MGWHEYNDKVNVMLTNDIDVIDSPNFSDHGIVVTSVAIQAIATTTTTTTTTTTIKLTTASTTRPAVTSVDSNNTAPAESAIVVEQHNQGTLEEEDGESEFDLQNSA